MRNISVWKAKVSWTIRGGTSGKQDTYLPPCILGEGVLKMRSTNTTTLSTPQTTRRSYEILRILSRPNPRLLSRQPLGRPDSTLSAVRWLLCPDVEFDICRRHKAVNYL